MLLINRNDEVGREDAIKGGGKIKGEWKTMENEGNGK